MATDDLIQESDLVSNPMARIPVCLCLDTSGSMDGDPIRSLEAAVHQFYDEILGDEVARFSAEICIITFGGTVQCLQDFCGIDAQNHRPSFAANGGTPLGEAVKLAHQLLERRKDDYKKAGVDYYQPWLVLMTDGQPNGDSAILLDAMEQTASLINDKKLTIFPIGIGTGADMDVLAKLSPNRSPLHLKGLKFKEFFSWLSQSVARTSMSTPGEAVKLDMDGVKGWAEL